MNKTISDEQIENEASVGYKPPVVDAGFTELPFSELGDREFELLMYLLFKDEISNNTQQSFSSISLMQGVGERGRDCILFKDGIVAGVIQCKKLKARITRPATIKEIIKFLLFAHLDPSLLPDATSFEYKLCVAFDLAETTLNLFNKHPHEINIEVSNGLFANYVQQVIEEYESFKELRDKPPTDAVIDSFKKIKLTYENSTSLTSKLYENTSLLSKFFKIITVIDLNSTDKLIRQAFEDYGVKLLTDEDLIELKDRISQVNSENRFSLGFVDFFGLNVDFFKYLKGDKFESLMKLSMSLISEVDKHVMLFAREKIHEFTLKEITFKLLNTGKIHPFSVQVAPPYLFAKISNYLFKDHILKSLYPNDSPFRAQTNEQLIDFVSAGILASSEKILNGNTSEIAGSPEIVRAKILMYEQMHSGINNINEARGILSHDVKTLLPALEMIFENLKCLVQPERTIVLKDTLFLNDRQKTMRMLTNLNKIS
ncbi:Uncharacterised protein [Enterobacter cloacae]|uniref:hypothetical protein n=1 Tax=Enterobacter cloacae TaxID=550 RepID=UPI0007998319|nr:hypothetical protein [Enterobacter cloacae]SAD69869.1 Uncharacterised protein [Enterobacter cloacae]